MLIDLSYFFGDRAIPQLSQPSVKDNVEWYIKVYEKKFFAELLGYPFNTVYQAGLVANDPLYLNIQNGAEYLDSDLHTQKWIGLKVEIIAPIPGNPEADPPVADIPGRYLSPIADYIYWNYCVNNLSSFLSASGEKTVKNENSVDTSIWPRLIRIWNEMVIQNRMLVDFLLADENLYPEFRIYYNTVPRSREFNLLTSKRNPVI
jgi:hypothetical protein